MTTETNTVELATELTIAWLSNPNTRTSSDDVPTFLKSMHDAVAALGNAAEAPPAGAETPEFTPAVSVRKSLASKDHIISMIDGKPYKTLRRHLSTNGLTPEEYRARYNLKADYPMVAETYSENRRAMAKKIGLGRKPKAAAQGAPASEEAPASATQTPAKRGKKLSIATA
ncbi:MucR family transcriptional regulator [Sphingomonas sanguinis]|jgi:predicted transcriptional regulator|uniref:MucR family transcriptional regulator n=1 Tax=Sphingomonas sanguinis TaxID=33051 RepID=A0A7Y7QYN5_9SPHN|nr:MucR family transcriptional regulator [Sphingomonas sanguinis]MBZ6383881.1 MucR family transcriptional regulator [Sphingomonas sanguinis]NNG51401.1 MucR family transcriptional regulator [Sphingomonas sanguinis]NVP33172.1 MucR family transcriptional regulator [Sphingomonas sanguinis]